jgi:hypothetical protein
MGKTYTLDSRAKPVRYYKEEISDSIVETYPNISKDDIKNLQQLRWL